MPANTHGKSSTGGTSLMACSRCGHTISSGFRLEHPRNLDGEAPFVCGDCREADESAWPASEGDYLRWTMGRLRAGMTGALAVGEKARDMLAEERRRGLSLGLVDLARVRKARRGIIAAVGQLEELEGMRGQLWPLLAGRKVLTPAWQDWSAEAGRRLADLRKHIARPRRG